MDEIATNTHINIPHIEQLAFADHTPLDVRVDGSHKDVVRGLSAPLAKQVALSSVVRIDELRNDVLAQIALEVFERERRVKRAEGANHLGGFVLIEP